jgi:hypothetical protein
MSGLLERKVAGGKRKPAMPPVKPQTSDKAKPKPAPEDDLYSSGDICAPEPDRDDEQRDL